MAIPNPKPRRAEARDLKLFSHPEGWPTWPFLPVIRHRKGGDFDCGVMFDAMRVCEQSGWSATVFLINLFELPPKLDEFFKVPKEVYDNAEEVGAAGWVVD